MLLEARDELAGLDANPWKAQKMADLEKVITDCAGLFVEATTNDDSVLPATDIVVTATALNRSPAPFRLKDVVLPGVTPTVDKPVDRLLAESEPAQIEKTIRLARDLAVTSPSWLDGPQRAGIYRNGVPEDPPALAVRFLFEVGGRALAVERPLIYKWTDPVAGERYRPIEITPPVTVNPDAAVLMFPDRRPRELAVIAKAARADVKGTLRLDLPGACRSEPPSFAFQLDHKGDEQEFRFRVTAGEGCGGSLQVVAEVDDRRWSRSMVRIEHSHIPIQTLFPPAEVKLVRFNLKTGGRKIGYVTGPGDEVPAALRQVGYEVTLLTDEQLASLPLDRFDAIVTGVRAFNTRPRLPFARNRLMEYVRAGGTLLVQYNTNNRLSKLSAEIGPWPFEISQDRVTDETAPVKPEVPTAPVLNVPNKIDAADFEGWIQERGLYFAGKWDDKYETPLSMHDPGEPPKRGALLVGRYGKGRFVYTGLAFFRQLPAGVPGAYRLFANLLGRPK